MSIYRPEMKVNPSQLVTTGTPSATTYLAGDGEYRTIDTSFPSTWYWADTSFYAKAVSVAADRYTLLSPNAMQIDIGGSSYTLSTQVSIDLSTAANWDDYADDGDWDSTNYTTAANRAGKDFYVFAVTPLSGTAPRFLLSANSTTPLGGYDEDTSRKVGGFHCLCSSMSTPGTRANSTAYVIGSTILSGSYWYRSTCNKAWVASTAFSSGDLVFGGSNVYECTTAGTSAASVPTWPGSGTVTDGGAVWTFRGASGASLTSGGSAPTFGTTLDGFTRDGSVQWLCEPIHPASGYVTGDIIPNSVWDLKFRSSSGNNAGLAYVDKLDKWLFIYLQSGEGASTASVYNGTIKDTRTWFNHVDDLSNMKCLLLDDQEFQVAAEGSNQATNITGSSDPVTTGGHTDTAGRRMISHYFIEDCCGATWQWIRDQCYQTGSGSAGWKDVVGSSKGQVYLMADNAHIKVRAGGNWDGGVLSGSRARGFANVGWFLRADFGARGSCGSIKK